MDFKTIIEKLDKNSKIAIFTHRTPDPDAIGSALGIKWLLKKKFEIESDLFYCGEISHKQNQTLVNVLSVDLRNFNDYVENKEAYTKVIMVDGTPKNLGEKDIKVDIEFGQQGITSLREKTTTAKEAVKNILEGDLFSEDALRALDKRNTSVFQENVERKDQGGVLAKVTQPQDVKVEQMDSITTPEIQRRDIKGTIEQFGIALGLREGRSMLGQKSIMTPDGRALPFASMLGEIRKMTLEEFEKLANLNIIVDKSSDVKSVGKATKTNL